VRVRLRREALGMSQTELGRALGVTFQQVQKYENGKSRIAAGQLQALSKILSVPVPYFFENAGSPPQKSADSADEALPLSVVSEFLPSPDGKGIAKAFTRIASRRLRRAIVRVAERLAELP
jgi:transcriptional regulator with XRE-family HTH domain